MCYNIPTLIEMMLLGLDQTRWQHTGCKNHQLCKDHKPPLRTLIMLIDTSPFYKPPHNLSTTETTSELCAGVVKATGVYPKNPMQHMCDLEILEEKFELKPAFVIQQLVRESHYFMLGNISPRLRSQLKSIQLLAIAKASIVEKYGVKTLLEPFMQDLKILEGGTLNSILHMHTYIVLIGSLNRMVFLLNVRGSHTYSEVR